MTKKIILKFVICTCLFNAYHSMCSGQGKKGNNFRRVSEEKLQGFEPKNVDRLEFKNINKIPYYYNKKALQVIKKQEEARDYKKLHHRLNQYVENFGVQNFYKDTYLLWRLAKLEEIVGDMDRSKYLYKLVLKHHRTNIDIKKIELHYDSLNVNDADYYVPLEYYYELVEYRAEVDTLLPPRGVLLNMGEAINSDLSDYGPSISLSDDVFLFTSKRNEKRNVLKITQNEDIFFSTKADDFWKEAEALNGINTSFNEGSPYLSKDGKTLYFARCNSPESYGNCDIFIAEMQPDSTWEKIRNLGPNVNSNAWDSHPSLSHSEDTLYFASDRIGGFGLSDIYFTYKDKNGEWAPAQNAGPTINTRQNDVSPFYHPKYNILYFSSNGQLLNFGAFDIYKSYKKKNFWGEPKNIGPLVNGAGNEFYFTIDSESRDLFYARSKEANMDHMDLFSFPLPMEAQPKATTQFRGTLTDSLTGKPYKGIVSIIDLDNGIEVSPKFLRPDGSYEFDLINNNNYLLIIQGDEFFRIEEVFHLKGNTEYHQTTAPVSSKLEFASIEFDNGKASLRPEMYSDLDKIADFLLDNPDFKLKISGHTDSDGNEAFNLQLSQKRAESIREYLIYFGGVDGSRIDAKGYGSSRKIVAETNNAQKALNRRVEFEIFREAEKG